MIEAALRDCKGRVSGPLGAAVKLGLPRSTLESKIRSLLTAPVSHKLGNVCHCGRLSFFRNAAYRGSLCKLFSRGSTLVPIKPPSFWA